MQVDEVLAWDEMVDPDQVASLRTNARHQRVHLGADFRGVRAAGADDDLVFGVQLQRSSKQMREALLTRDASVEEGVWAAGIDAVSSQRCFRGSMFVDLRVDPVVDDMNAPGIDSRVALEHVIANPARNRDHRIRRLDRGALAEKG